MALTDNSLYCVKYIIRKDKISFLELLLFYGFY